MLSKRILQRIEAFLDEADVAATGGEWGSVAEKARAVLALDDGNEDALAYLKMAEANLGASAATPEAPAAPVPAPTEQPASFAAGRYQVKRFLGEGGKKKVFLAYDALLDRDVAFALIKTEGLDDVGRERVTREAQAMGRMGAHPHVVSVFDLGEEQGAPYIVTELMGGGDVEGELERAGGPLALPRTLEVAKGVARGLAFAHERGVVHRDLKPGNVWLTSGGVAKIGDFGLAVAEGRSRLTQHGLMVGTFGYMPPEQALGGEATPRSDLYSLGAMLYELVTGRPPFEGDTPTAVISQHLNSAPVAPSWHSEHCPPALEDLILALLQKDPAHRPASASEVLKALETVDPEQKSRSHSSDSANPLDRLARGVFVGRERELERLRGALDNALAGRGSVVMLVGEPGIGKTRTTQELETYARMRGAKVLWGRAHESSGAPPYWPWVQVGRAYREETPDAEIRRRQYEPYAVELQRIFPALRDLFPGLAEPPAETEEGQFRLFDAFSAFARSVAVETPLVFVLDDLHWADGATLGLLTHLARELARARILVVGTYRDTDLDRRHPLATALAELGREDLFSRVNLRGLSLAETQEYIRQTASVEPPRELVSRIYEETEGNPFFLSEVVNLMTEEGAFTRDSISDIAVPEGVRQALGRRLDRLSEDANELLTVLAVAGRDFEHALAQSLSSHDDATTLRLLEEALRVRVLEEGGAGRYRFTHALMQETLLAELSAARRVLLHGQIAESMEHLYGEDPYYVAGIAQHYFESAALNVIHRRGAARYLRLAAELAMTSLAHAEAAQYYERCIGLVQDEPDGLGEKKAALWTELAFCRMLTGEVPRGWEACEEALAAAVNADPVARLRILARVAPAAPIPAIRYRRALLEGTLAAFGGQAAPEACTLLALIACADATTGGDAAAAAATEMARNLQLTGADYPWLLKGRPARAAIERGDFRQALAESERMETEAISSWASERSHLVTIFMAALYSGDIARLVAVAERIIKRAQECGDGGIEQTWVASLARINWLRGAAAAPPYGPDLQKAGSHFPKVMAAAHALEQGDSDFALHLLPPVDAEQGWSAAISGIEGLRAAALHALGDTSKAREALERWLTQFERTSLLEERAVCAAGDPLCALADDAVLQRVAAQYLAVYPAMRYWPPYSSGPDHLRGAIAIRLDNVDEAEGHFRTGLEWATRPDVNFWLDEGRCHQGLAEVAERRGQHLEAMQHLDTAGELFAKHGAKLYLDEVLAKKEILKA